MKKLFWVIYFVLMLVGCDHDHISKSEKVCATPATIKVLPSCGYVFQLDDGTIIEPYRILYCGTPPLPKGLVQDPLYSINWMDGKKVMIGFNEIDSMASTCKTGKVAKITCLLDLEPDKTCIESVIDKIKSEEVRNPPAKIFEYTYHSNKVYFIPQHCCDIPSILMDENCNTICNPDGGISGAGDGRCKDFFSERQNEKIIWVDDRVVTK